MIISRFVRMQLIAFAILSVFGIAYVGLRYVGVHVFDSPYQVRAYFHDSGGIFPNANVTVRGVSVGTVQDLKIVPQGVEVVLSIDPGHKIPKDSTARVADLSAVGEQYVDIEPQTDKGPYFQNGDKIPASRTSVPVPNAELIKNLDQLVTSVNRKDLSTVIDELGKAFGDTGPALQSIIDNSNTLTAAAQQNLPQTRTLINDGATVLDTQRAVSQELKTFAANLRSFSAQLDQSDPDLRRTLDAGVTAAQQVTSLLDDNRTELPVLLRNLVTLGNITKVRLPGVETMLTLYPGNVADGFYASAPIPGISGDKGIAHFGFVLGQSPNDCTNGYGATNRKNDNSSPSKLNTDFHCLPPSAGDDPSTSQATAANPGGTDARGAYLAPRPSGDDTATADLGGGAAPSSSSSSQGSSGAKPSGSHQNSTVAPYDPATGLLVGPNGKPYELGSTGGQEQVLGDTSWEWLLIGPLSH